MKKVFLFSLLLITVLCSYFISTNQEIQTPYQYPVVPGTIEWENFESRSDMIEACQIPQDTLERLSTDALLQTILDYPFLSEMVMFYRTPEEREQELGFWHIANSFNGLQEFMKREDALSTLEEYGSFNNLDNNGSPLVIIYRNIIRSAEPVKQK